jgi:hypothetical protein
MKNILIIGLFFLGLSGYSQTATKKVVKHEAKKEVKKAAGIETSPAKTVKKAVGLEPTPAEKAKKAVTNTAVKK